MLQGVLPGAGRRGLERGRSARMLRPHVDQQRLVRDAGDRVAQRARARLRLGSLDLPAPRPAASVGPCRTPSSTHRWAVIAQNGTLITQSPPGPASGSWQAQSWLGTVTHHGGRDGRWWRHRRTRTLWQPRRRSSSAPRRAMKPAFGLTPGRCASTKLSARRRLQSCSAHARVPPAWQKAGWKGDSAMGAVGVKTERAVPTRRRHLLAQRPHGPCSRTAGARPGLGPGARQGPQGAPASA